MRRGGSILIVLGLILGAITAAGMFLVVSQMQTGSTPIPTRSVVVALQNIPNRTEISTEAVGKQDWPEAVLPAGAFEKTEDVVGKLALQPIYPGQIILPPMIIEKGMVGTARSNASFVIPAGKVAVAFPISELSSVASALQAGDTVDILLTLPLEQLLTAPRTGTTTTTPTGTEALPVTQLMLQNVLILQVGTWVAGPQQQQQQNAPVAGTITFVLDRQDALALKSAREQGTIELALRRAGDDKTTTTEAVNLQYLVKRFNFTPGQAR